MTRLLYDQFGKQLLKELLSGVGEVETFGSGQRSAVSGQLKANLLKVF
ncbi:MAG: hypothetical protein F6J93_33930 [Oscillatoria sp. SIO1A7]|nr:hypothetical protein [Oscillatoria sp. SIO1A7]